MMKRFIILLFDYSKILWVFFLISYIFINQIILCSLTSFSSLSSSLSPISCPSSLPYTLTKILKSGSLTGSSSFSPIESLSPSYNTSSTTTQSSSSKSSSASSSSFFPKGRIWKESICQLNASSMPSWIKGKMCKWKSEGRKRKSGSLSEVIRPMNHLKSYV